MEQKKKLKNPEEKKDKPSGKKITPQKVKDKGKHPFINTKPVTKDEPSTRDPAPDPINEALTLTRRRQLAQQMMRMSRKLEVARKVAQNKFAPDKRLKVRAGKMARNIFRKRLAGQRGVKYKELSAADKIAIDKILDKNNPRVRKLAKRLFPVVKKAEGIRLQKHRRTPSNKGSSPVRESYETEVITMALLEADSSKLDILLKAGLADQQSLQQYKKAMADLEQSVKYNQYRKKVLTVLERLIEVVTNNDAIFNKVKQDLQTKRRLKEQQALAKKAEASGIPLEIISEVYERGLSAWKEGSKYTREQYGFARVNSFIAGGKARELDKDLAEACGIVKEEGGAGEQGTPELTRKYMEDTPGQESALKLLKKIVRENVEAQKIKKDADAKVAVLKAKKTAIERVDKAKDDVAKAQDKAERT